MDTLDQRDPRRAIIRRFLLPGLAGVKFTADDMAEINEHIGRILRAQPIETACLPDGRTGWRRSESEPWKNMDEVGLWPGPNAADPAGLN